MIGIIKKIPWRLAGKLFSNTRFGISVIILGLSLAGCATAPMTTLPQTASAPSQVQVVGSTLYITGDIDFATVAKVGQQDTDHVTTVTLRSHGGSVNLALLLSAWVKSKSLNTAVTNYCESACTLILASGKARLGTRDARFLIHGAAYNLQADSRLAGEISGDDGAVTAANRAMRAHYLEQGVNPDFIKRAVQSPRPPNEHDITAAEALRIGLLTEVRDF